jgi:hypothetical protein
LSRRDDAPGLANGKQVVLAVGCNDAAAVGCKESGLEIERAKEMGCGVQEWDSSGPASDKLGWIWSLNGRGAEWHQIP